MDKDKLKQMIVDQEKLAKAELQGAINGHSQALAWVLALLDKEEAPKA